jgi:hypothetical protein
MNHRNLALRPVHGLARTLRTLGAALALTLAAAAAAEAQVVRHDLGYLDDIVYYRATLTSRQPAVEYWFYLRYGGTTVLATVQDFGGRGIDQATLFDAAGAVKAESRGRIGAQIGAANLGAGWHRLLVRSSKDSHLIGVTLEPRRPGEPADVGNDFNTAHDLGVVGSGGTVFPNRVGLGDSADFYRFQLTGAQNHLEVSLLQTRREGAYVEIYALSGSQAHFVNRAPASGLDTPVLTERLPAGTYFARITAVTASSGPQSTSYHLYLRALVAAPDPAGDLRNPYVIPSIPTPRPIAESVQPMVDGSDAFRFTVPSSRNGIPVRVAVAGSSHEFAIYLLDGNQTIFANDTRAVASKQITRSLAGGTYYVFVISLGRSGHVDYRLGIEAQLPATPAPPAPIPRIAYRGFLFDDHSANTTLAPLTIPVGGTFRVTSSTMPFAGAGKQLAVVLEPLNRIPGSSGVGNLLLRGVTVRGNTLTVQGPNVAVYGRQTYRVIVITYTNGLPDDYASPGLLRVN